MSVEFTRKGCQKVNTIKSVTFTLYSVDTYRHFAGVKFDTVGVVFTPVILLCSIYLSYHKSLYIIFFPRSKVFPLLLQLGKDC